LVQSYSSLLDLLVLTGGGETSIKLAVLCRVSQQSTFVTLFILSKLHCQFAMWIRGCAVDLSHIGIESRANLPSWQSCELIHQGSISRRGGRSREY
jgi:hypothetical protein